MQAKGQSVLYLDRERTKERKKSLTESFGVCVCVREMAVHLKMHFIIISVIVPH